MNQTPYHFVILGSKNSSDFDTEMKTATGGSGKVYYFKAGKKVALYITNKFTGVSVRKVWLDENGGIQTSGMPENIQVQLYRQKTQLDARTVTLNFSSNNNQTPAPVHYYVKPGTPFELVIKDCWDTLKISWNGTSKVINNNGVSQPFRFSISLDFAFRQVAAFFFQTMGFSGFQPVLKNNIDCSANVVAVKTNICC